MNRLIQMEAAARWRLLISAAAHWVRSVRAGCSFRAHPSFWLRDQ
eukprot:COSAG01_NODE_31260_length_600_cov_73.003992_1_plen_44_part_10